MLYFGGISTTTKTMIMLLPGYWTRFTHRSLIKPIHWTLDELNENEDTINMNEDGSIPPFYVILTIHDQILHNAMLDTGASHNLMPRALMETINLDITRPYKDLFSFDSSKVQCIGLIKDLCVNLVQYPGKSMIMDVVELISRQSMACFFLAHGE